MKNITLYILLVFSIFYVTIQGFCQENCDNGIDDDGDGFIDLFDDECECEGFNTNQIVPSLIPNPSFENHSCTPWGFAQLTCADTWIQATTATSDYFNFNGGWTMNSVISTGLAPPPDGTGYVGAIIKSDWKEYIGACLISPLITGDDYTLSFYIASLPTNGTGDLNNGGSIWYGDIDISIYGSTSCLTLPVNTLGCPSNASPSWSLIGSATYTPVSSWGILTIDIIPTFDVNAIMIGGPCTLPSNYLLAGPGTSNPYGLPYFIFDDLTLAERSAFGYLDINTIGGWCTNDLILSAYSDTIGGAWQWYKDNIALIGETSHVLNISSNNLGTGVYTVKQTIGNNCELYNYTVSIPDSPLPDFSTSALCMNQIIQFNDLTTNNASITSWEWDFGDGNFSNIQNPSHVYTSAGIYNVQLQVIDQNGCSDIINRNIEIYNVPIVSFSSTDPTICLGEAIDFFNTSDINNIPIQSWDWDFGNGIHDPSFETSYTYTIDGSYTVTLHGTSYNGCESTDQLEVTIHPLPIAGFSTNPTETPNNSYINIEDLSNGTNLIEWDWGDGESESSDFGNMRHLYKESGQYVIEQIVFNQFGCTDTAYQTVIINDTLVVYIPNSFSPDGDGYNDVFKVNGTDLYDKEFNFTIINRWGQIMFEGYSPAEGWDGTYRGIDAQIGVYVYQLLIKNEGKTNLYSGFVALIR